MGGHEGTVTTMGHAAGPGGPGRVLHWAAGYDLLVWLLLLGRERAFRDRLAALASLAPGQSVLDVGCGTGSLAIAAKRSVGPAGRVVGVDASPVMIARAARKARRAGLEVTLTTAVAQRLPGPDAQFDRVLNTLMLHHLSAEGRQQCALEMRRVLKPGGRVLAVDFGKPAATRRSLIGHLHRHSRLDADRIAALLRDAGLEVLESGPVGVLGLDYVLAGAP